MKNSIGCYFKAVRLDRRILKKDICEACCISMQYLSKIEDDTVYMSISKETTEKISEVLGISIINDNNLNRFFEKTSDQFIESCIFGIEDEAKLHFKEISKFRSKLTNTMHYPIYLLMEFIYCVLFDKDSYNLDHNFQILFKVSINLERKYLQLFNLYSGIYYKMKNKLELSEESIRECQKIGHNDLVLGLSYYHLGSLLIRKGKYLDALLSGMKANVLLDSTNNFIRKVQNLTHMGITCHYLREFDEAIQYCNEAIRCAELLNDNLTVGVNYNNLAWISLIQKDYGNVRNYTELAFQNGRKDSILYFHNAYANLKMGKKKVCSDWVEKGMERCETRNLDYRLLRLVRDMNNHEKNQEKYLEEIVAFFEKHNKFDMDIRRFLYQELVDCKKEKKKFDEAWFVCEKMQKTMRKN